MGSDARVLVLGGSGHYGRKIVGALLRSGTGARVLSRSADSARELLGPAPELVQGDLTSSAPVAELVDGVASVVIAVSAFSPKLIRKRWLIEHDSLLAFLERAASAGLRRVVYLSGYDAREELLRPLGLMKFGATMIGVQKWLRGSDLNWTVLGCAPSTELYFSMIRGNVMNVPGGGPPALPTLAGADLGTIAAQAALRQDLGGQHFHVMGTEALSFPEAARRISAVWGREIRVRKIPLAPIRIASVLAWPFYPYLHHLYGAVKLMNNFPEQLAAQVPKDYQRLRATFDYEPLTLEDEARQRATQT